jgi:hypothetical protein
MTNLGKLDTVSLKELKQVSRHFRTRDTYRFLHTCPPAYPLLVNSITDGLTLKYM